MKESEPVTEETDALRRYRKRKEMRSYFSSSISSTVARHIGVESGSA